MPDHENTITVFAKTNFRNKEVPFGIKTDDRRRHMYLIGKTGMGKTTLMENMVIQDIKNGHGVAFLDPHGDSIQRILNSIPNSRVNDVIYFNPADLDYPVAFNILESVDPKYKHLVASGLMGVFTKIWANLWSARMEYILNNTILALLDSPGNTLLGITRMYVDKKYRKKIVDNVKDPMVRAFWVDEYANYNEKYRTEAIAPIQNKVGQFLSSGIIRNIVGQPKSTIDLREIMDQQKILIMDLSKGKVGEDNSALLGAMLVTKIQLAAMSRTDIPEEERKDFYLYVDEFQNFATDSFATILSEARKYRLNLIVGHQYIGQLVQEKNTKVRDAIFGNVGTLVVFRIGAEDAEFLVKEFEPVFTEIDIVNLPKYNILLKLMINGVASDPFSAVTLSPNLALVTGNSEKTIKVSRERYSNPVAEVEEKISRWMGAEYHQENAVSIGGKEEDLQTQTVVVENPKLVEIGQPKEAIVEMPAPNIAAVEEQKAQTQKTEAKAEFFFSQEEAQKNLGEIKPKAIPKFQTQQQQNRAHPARQEAGHRTERHQDRYDNNGPRQNFGGQRDNRQPKRSGQPQPVRHSFQQVRRSLGEVGSGGGKKENPIWNKVAEIQQEKNNQANQNTSRVVNQIFNNPAPERQNQAAFSAQKPQPQQSAQPEQRKILQPGQTHSL